ncbi:MAG TPA: roadblock/LC7 domain-containing protein [Thermoplasmata archaeon]|nr:roadblock/LC7 domain-containing protein [Thermoplasmata archaeon]
MTDVWQRMQDAIEQLSHVSDIKAAAVVRRDGLVITHTLPDGVDPKIVAAMTAAIVGTSEMATLQLGQGRFTRAIIESDEGKLLSTGAGEEALLVTLVYSDANLGLVLMAMEKAAKQVEEILAMGAVS